MIKFFKTYPGITIFLAGLLFNLLESLWFGRGTELGFNMKPMSMGKLVCDYIAIGLMAVGAFIMFLDAGPGKREIKIKFIEWKTAQRLYPRLKFADENTPDQ